MQIIVICSNSILLFIDDGLLTNKNEENGWPGPAGSKWTKSMGKFWDLYRVVRIYAILRFLRSIDQWLFHHRQTRRSKKLSVICDKTDFQNKWGIFSLVECDVSKSASSYTHWRSHNFCAHDPMCSEKKYKFYFWLFDRFFFVSLACFDFEALKIYWDQRENIYETKFVVFNKRWSDLIFRHTKNI
jgi:hypothetical protein